MPLQPDADPRRNVRNSVNFLRMVGRLKPNVTPQQAHAELEAIRQNLRREYPGIYTGKIGLTLVPLTEEIVMNIKSVLLTISARPAPCFWSAASIWPAFLFRGRQRDNASWQCAQHWVPREAN